MSDDVRPKGHDLVRRILLATGLVMAGALAVTWSWNVIVQNLAGPEQLRFAEGLSLAVLAPMLGALFELGRRLIERRGTER